MATIDIGKIKPVFKGTYDNSTAYVLDDIVYYNGSSYVAKTSTTGNLPTDTTKWNILASGSGGIWDSTLSIGSANQQLRVSSGGALEFYTPVVVSSDFTRLASLSQTSEVASFSIDGYFTSDYDVYKLYIMGARSDGNKFQVRVNHSGTAQTGSNYQYLANYVDLTTGNSGNNSVAHSTNDTQVRIGWQDDTATRRLNAELTIFDPLNTERFKQIQYHSGSFLGSYWYGLNGFFQYESTTALSGLTFKGHSSELIGFDHVYLYGLKNS
jgi:hypothetical protein